MARLNSRYTGILGRFLPTEDLLTTILRQGAGMLAVRMSSLAVLFGVQLLLARLLGTQQFGVYIVALSVMGILQLLARQGFEIAASRFVGTYSGLGQWPLLHGFVNASRLLVLGGAAIFGGGLVIVSIAISGTLGDGVLHSLWLVAAILPVFTLLQLEAAIIRGMGRAAIADIPTWIIHPVALAAGVTAVVSVSDEAVDATTALSVFLLTAIGVLAIQHVAMIRVLPRAMHDVRPEYRWVEWMKAAPAMMLFAGSAVLLSQANTVILGSMVSTAEAGIYNIATRIAGILQLLTFCFIAAIGPVAARLHAKGDLDELERIIAAGARMVFAGALAASIVLAIAGGPILAMFGKEFSAGYDTLMVLVAGQLFWAATVPAGVLLNMTGHHNLSGKILLLSAAVNFALCALLVPEYGSMGAAIATSAAVVLWNGIMSWTARRRVGIRACVTFW